MLDMDHAAKTWGRREDVAVVGGPLRVVDALSGLTAVFARQSRRHRLDARVAGLSEGTGRRASRSETGGARRLSP